MTTTCNRNVILLRYITIWYKYTQTNKVKHILFKQALSHYRINTLRKFVYNYFYFI